MKLHVHVHDGSGALIGGETEKRSRKTAKPLWSKSLLDDLISRLLGTTSDEAGGHPFHGNQYVQVAGQNVEVPQKGSVKEKLHHLFAQGHKFTIKELAALLGQSEVTLRGRLSEIKKAAPALGLYLEKDGDHFSIKQKEAETPLDKNGDVIELMEPYKAPEPAAATPAPPAPVAPPPAPPEPVAEPKQTLAEKTLPDVGTFDPPADGPMQKAQADNLYNDKLSKWMETVQGAGFPAADTIEPDTIDALATGWKNTKANAMAEWKANTSGVAQKAKDLGVFQADKQLVKDVIGGMTMQQAMAAWKQNTAGEKAGTWPPDPLAAEKKAAAEKMAELANAALAEAAKIKAVQIAATHAALEAEALKEYGPHFAPVTNYMPADHDGIKADDFLDGTYANEFRSINTKLFGAGSNSAEVQNKVEIQHALDTRLASSKAFQAMVAQRGNHGMYNGNLSANLIAAWAGSSGDHQPVSVAAQLAIREAFGMKEADVATDALHLITKSSASEDEVYSQAASSLHCKFSTPAERVTFKSGLRDFMLAQYHNTQDYFKAKGITHVYVARGSGGDVGVLKDTAATHGKVRLQPASSFACDMQTASGFSKGDSVYLVKVPASQVLGSARTGYGCTGEHEIVVLAHPKTAAVRIPYAKASSLEGAVDYVKATLQTGPSASSEALAKYEATKAAKHAKAELEAQVHAKIGGPAPVVPKYSNYGKSMFSKTAYVAAKKGDVEAVKKIVASFVEHKAKSGSYSYHTTPYMETITGHAEKVAAHKKEALLAKAQIKAEAKAAKGPAAKPKKPAVHVHVHEPASAPKAAEPAGYEPTWNNATEKWENNTAPEPAHSAHTQASIEHGKLWSEFLAGGGENWIKSHSHFNPAKYQQMVSAGKTPIQIKHYLGSLKHAAAKKQGASA